MLGRNPQFYRDWIAHPDYDAYWKALNAEEVFEKIGIPVHTLGG
jgi:predicted acyl esterase